MYRSLTSWALATAALIALVGSAEAQGYPGGGGGMGGGMGRRGGGMGRGGQGGQRPSGSDVEHRFEDMSQLKKALDHIDLQNTQKDSMKALEKIYKPQFSDYGKAARSMFEQNGRPDRDSLTVLRTAAEKLRDEEFAEARKVLTGDQPTTFDQNVAKLKDDEEQRRSQMRDRAGNRQP